MPTSDLLPFPALLAPISDEAPSGPDPRRTTALSATFDKTTEAFRSATAVERQELIGEGGAPTPAGKLWGPVIAPAIELLDGKSKDMEVAGCLAQALVRMHALPGLRDGLRLIRELAEAFWDTLHPLPDSEDEDADPEDGDTRIVYIERLQSNPILTALRLAPITAAKGGGPFSHDFYLRAITAELATGDEAAAIAEDGRQRKAKIVAAAQESGSDYYIRWLEDFGLAMGHMDALENFLMERTGSSGLVLGKLRETLSEIERAVRDIGRGLIPEPADPAGDASQADDGEEPAGRTGPAARTGGGGGGGFRASGGDAARDREAALSCLADVAAFFKATEPHSPIGYTLDTVIVRARMPLPALLADLLGDDAARQTYLTTAGIRLPPED